VCRRNVRDLADLRQRIIEAVELITPHMLLNTLCYDILNSNVVKSGDLGGQAVGPSAYNTSHAAKHVAGA